MFPEDRDPKTCPLCGRPGELFQENGVASAPGVDMLICMSCNFGFQSVIPSQDDLERYYREEYRVEGGFKYSPEENFKKQENLSLMRWNRYMAEYFSPEVTVLDLACGTGNMMRLAASEGAQVFGVEAYAPFAEKAREQGVVQEAMVERMQLAQKFNTVFAIHILEHLRNPAALFAHLEQFITPGTRLFVECPNLRNVLVNGYKYDPAIPRFCRPHLWEFTPYAMVQFLTAMGWHVESAIPYQRAGVANHLWQMFNRGNPAEETYTLACSKEVREALVRADVAYRQVLETQGLTDTFLVRAVHP